VRTESSAVDRRSQENTGRPARELGLRETNFINLTKRQINLEAMPFMALKNDSPLSAEAEENARLKQEWAKVKEENAISKKAANHNLVRRQN